MSLQGPEVGSNQSKEKRGTLPSLEKSLRISSCYHNGKSPLLRKRLPSFESNWV